MGVWIALLRGVNVGGHHKIPMEALRRLCSDVGWRNPQTYIQSGNVVFESRVRKASQLAASIETAIEAEFGFRPDAMLRAAEELREAIDRNPFAAQAVTSPSKLAVSFLKEEPAAGEPIDFRPFAKGGEQVERIGRQLYLYFPEGMGKSKLQMPALERALRAAGQKSNSGTARNWNTVLALLAMAESRG